MSEYLPDRNKVIARIEKKKFSDGIEILIERVMGEIEQ